MTNFEKIKSMSINEMASKRLIWKDEFGDTHTSDERINGKFVGDRDVREKLFEYEQEEILKKPESFLGMDYSMHDLYVDSEGHKAQYEYLYRKAEKKLSLMKMAWFKQQA